MLKKRHRIRKSAEIQNMFSQARRAKIGDLFLLYRKTSPINTGLESRAVVVISKKFSLSAVKRNRQRRVITEALRVECVLEKGYDLIITYANKGKMLSYRDSVQAMEKIKAILST